MAAYTDLRAELTFGIELEFIAVFPDGALDVASFGNDIVAAISIALNDGGINATGHEHIDDDVSINGDSEPFASWNVSDEGGLSLSKAETTALSPAGEFIIQPIEISSRKMWFIEDWESEVATVLNVLDSFRAQGVRFITNATTGFHVHIGFGDASMPLRTTKGVLEICTAFEDRFDVLYPTNRIHEDDLLNVGAHFNASLSWHFSQNTKTSFSKNIHHWLAEIEECTSFKQLGDFFRNDILDTEVPPEGRPLACKVNGHYDELRVNTKALKSGRTADTTDAHFSTLNVDNLYTPIEQYHGDLTLRQEPTGTIEFRQHAGTLNFTEIHAHVEFLRALVSFCHLSKDTDFLQVFSRVSDPNFRLFDLMQEMGVKQHLLSHYHNRFCYDTQKRLDVRACDAKKAMDQYLLELNIVEHGVSEKLDALEAQVFLENWQRSNPMAVAQKIESKRDAGSYADLRTADLDVTGEYLNFVDVNGASVRDSEQLSTMGRTMIFQQLNGSDL